MLRWAARHAEIVSVFLTSLPDGSGFAEDELTAASYKAKTDLVRDASTERGFEPELNVLVQHVEVTSERGRAAEERARLLNSTPKDVLETPLELIGTIDQIVDDLRQRRETYGLTYITVFEKYMSAFAPVVEQLSGT